MHTSIKLVIRKVKGAQASVHTIFLQYCYTSTKRVLISTGIAIPETYWDKSIGCIRSSLPAIYGTASTLQDKLGRQRSKAEKIIRYAIQRRQGCPMQFLKRNIRLPDCWEPDQMEGDNNDLSLFNQIDKYLEDKKWMVKPATITVIKTMKKHLFSFQDYIGYPVTFDSLSPVFYDQFVRYLTFEIPVMRRATPVKGLRVNTVGKTIKQLKTFIKDRIAKKIIPYMDLSYFKGLEEDVEGIFLDWKELSKIYHLALSSYPGLIKYRDLFIVGCLTGFRFSDYSTLARHHLKEGMLHVRQSKTGATVVVPLREDAKKILIDKYGMRMPRVSMVNFNYYIKEVVKLASIDDPVKITHKRGSQIIEETRPKYAWISSHTARRSFCTNEYLSGTPGDLIMAISGHKTEIAFKKYIKADRIKKASMIKLLWDNQPGL
jgi:Phage integrase SAM-like domain/Phage integrase family/Arm DNA-binding domain